MLFCRKMTWAMDAKTIFDVICQWDFLKIRCNLSYGRDIYENHFHLLECIMFCTYKDEFMDKKIYLKLNTLPIERQPLKETLVKNNTGCAA